MICFANMSVEAVDHGGVNRVRQSPIEKTVYFDEGVSTESGSDFVEFSIIGRTPGSVSWRVDEWAWIVSEVNGEHICYF